MLREEGLESVRCVGEQKISEVESIVQSLMPQFTRVVRKVIFDPVPRNPTGKIEKPLLRKRYGGNSASFQSGSED